MEGVFTNIINILLLIFEFIMSKLDFEYFKDNFLNLDF